jgi:hypothetical protein
MILASVPVRLEGNSMKFTPSNPPPERIGSFFQVIRNRFSGLRSHNPILAKDCLIESGIKAGFFICAKDGITIFCSLARVIPR